MPLPLNASCVKCLKLCWKVQQLIDSQLLCNVEGFKGALLQSRFAKRGHGFQAHFVNSTPFYISGVLCK